MERSVKRRVVRSCNPDTIEAELEALWRELATETPAARAIMSNLIVFRHRSAADDAGDEPPIGAAPIEDLAERHPARIILLIHEDDPRRARGPMGASVSILLFGADDARHAVEQITIRSVCAAESLPSIVRRLVLGDLPTSVWWTEDLSQLPPVAALVAMGRQFVYDSRQWRNVGAGLSTLTDLLGRPHPPDLVDVNWRALGPMRQALMHGFRGRGPEAGATPVRVRIHHDPRDEAKAWLMVGWLASELGSTIAHRSLVSTVDQSDVAALSIAIEYGDGSSLSAEMDDVEVLVKDTSVDIPFSVRVPTESIAQAVSAELRGLGRDIAHAAAIRAAHERLISAT
jgi:glucose-6-phosphate dehydrogenase assembly protein OpcA